MKNRPNFYLQFHSVRKAVHQCYSGPARSFSIVNPCSILDSKALWRQLQVIQHYNSILHHKHHPPWLRICLRRSQLLHPPVLGITSMLSPGLIRTSILAGKQSTKVYRAFSLFYYTEYLVWTPLLG